MPETAIDPGIHAGRQTPVHEQASRILWLRKPGEVFRFLLDTEADPGLVLERIGPAAGGVLSRGAEARAAGRAVDSGLAIVDGEDGLAFCSTAEPEDFLHRLARYATAAVGSLPALALLADSGAGPLTVDPADDEAAKNYLPEAARVAYVPDLWDDLLVADAATIAAALAATPPGERMWFWLAEDEAAAGGALPLIVQPVAWDPNHDRMTWLIERNAEAGAGKGGTGTATIRDDGTIQFLGFDLCRPMLAALARWVARHAAEYPALGRLVDCQLLVSSGGTVEEVIADPVLWQDVQRAEVPATMRATSAVLEALPLGGECWFWLTAATPEAVFLHLVPVVHDPEGEAFRAEIPGLFRRFGRSFEDAVSGVMSRFASDRLLFSAAKDVRAAAFPGQIKTLLDRYAAEFPALRALGGATLLGAAADGAPRVLATATPA